jgi:N-acetyl-S-(2-succino)cysteine monooxygenase
MAQMKLAAFPFFPGAVRSAWRLPDAVPQSDMDFSYYAHCAQTIERGKFDAIFFQDTNAVSGTSELVKGNRARAEYGRAVRLDPMTVLPALAMLTTHLGLISTSTTTYNEPFHVARRYASLDHVSKGRAGWNLVTSQMEDEAGNFGLAEHPDHAFRYRRAHEFFDVVTGLWDSWDEDALLYDKEQALYFDFDKVHLLNHEGEFFSCRGPLNIARPVQGRPVVAQAGSSEPGRELAGRTADIVFTAQVELAEAKAFYSDIKGRAVSNGRAAEDIKVLPGFVPIVGRTEAEAQEKFELLQSVITDDVALQSLARHTGGLNLRDHDLDGPLPELPPSNSAQGRQQLLVDVARREHLSIRQLARRNAASDGHRLIVGTGESIADRLEEWFTAEAADGFVVMFSHFPAPVDEFVDNVVPALQRRGLFRTEYEGSTLRENLGLSRPESRYSLAAHR